MNRVSNPFYKGPNSKYFRFGVLKGKIEDITEVQNFLRVKQKLNTNGHTKLLIKKIEKKKKEKKKIELAFFEKSVVQS